MANPYDYVKGNQYGLSEQDWNNAILDSSGHALTGSALTDSLKEAQAYNQKQASAAAVNNFNPGTFQYNANNPAMQAIQNQVQAGAMRTGENQASQLASRGVQDSGQSAMASARNQQLANTNISNARGQDFQNGLTNFNNQNQQKFQNLLSTANMNTSDYQNAQNNYYQDLAVQSQNAMNEFQKQQANDPWNKYIAPLLGAGAGLAGSVISSGIKYGKSGS